MPTPVQEDHDVVRLRAPRITDRELSELSPPPVPISDSQIARIDRNFLRIEQAITELSTKVAARPRRVHRTASAARVNPDRLWFGNLILGINAAFATAMLIASFAGQYAFAPYTTLPVELWWIIPLCFDLPIMSSSFTALVFRKRKEREWPSWAFMTVLTVFASAVQVVHVLDEARFFAGAELSLPQWFGVAIMGSLPWLILVSWENLSRLLVKPTGEASDKTPEPKRRPAPKKRSTKS